MKINKDLSHPLWKAQDAIAEGKPVNLPVSYPPRQWRPIEDLRREPGNSGMGPSGRDIWLYSSKLGVTRYVNWSGSNLCVQRLAQDGYILWADAVEPLPPSDP